MISRRVLLSLLCVSSINILLANSAYASISSNLHEKLGQGHNITAQEAESLNSIKDFNNPFEHFVAGEVLVSLGLYGQAEAEFESADRLQKDYVQTKFREELKLKHHTLRFIAPYLQKKYPNDPALLFYLATRDLAGIEIKQDLNKVSLEAIIDEFKHAGSVPNAVPGTLAVLALLEYNEASRPKPDALQTNEDALLESSIKHAHEELKRDPANFLALKILILSTIKKGCAPDKLESNIVQALKLSPLDSELNLMLAHIYMARKDYSSATRPVLICLLTATSPSAQSLSLALAHDLARHADATAICVSSSKLIGESNLSNSHANLLYLLVADLLSSAGKVQQSLELLFSALKYCPPDFRVLFELRIGQNFTLIHRYEDAYGYLDKALKSAPNPTLKMKILQMRNRAAQLHNNSHRDAAAHFKKWISNM